MLSYVTAGGEEEKKPWLFRLISRIVRWVSPKYTLCGTEKLPEESCVIVGNHSQMYGPIAAELYMPRPQAIWCVGEMMNRKEVPAYAFQDFWSGKPRWLHWYYRLASHVIAPLAAFVLSSAHTIPVYHDARVMTTFRKSMEQLKAGADIVIFPEKSEHYNGIVCRFQEYFVDLAKLYYRRAGAALCFVPMYVAPRLGSIHFGDPVRYCPGAPDDEERKRICDAMIRSITDLAVSLPQHIVVPYENIPKKQYPLNTECAADGPRKED